MSFLRKSLKTILGALSKAAINKHDIKFVVVVGWHGTTIVKEGIYQLLDEKYNARRNIEPVWWDLSIPLLVLGYDDRQRNIFRWIALIIKTSFSLLVNPKNPHKIIVDLSLADENTSKYWGDLIKPEVLVITSYKPDNNFTIEELVKVTRIAKGKILVSNEIEENKFNQFTKFGYKSNEKHIILVGNNEYAVNDSLSSVLIQTYSPVVAVASTYGWSNKEIMDGLAKFDSIDILTKKIKKGLVEEAI